jgi:hypothetical protein
VQRHPEPGRQFVANRIEALLDGGQGAGIDVDAGGAAGFLVQDDAGLEDFSRLDDPPVHGGSNLPACGRVQKVADKCRFGKVHADTLCEQSGRDYTFVILARFPREKC